jgi:hypothetical protein
MVSVSSTVMDFLVLGGELGLMVAHQLQIARSKLLSLTVPRARTLSFLFQLVLEALASIW